MEDALSDWLVSLEAFQRGLEAGDEAFWTGLSHGTMRVELYAPQREDTQQPHDQDELYIILRGTGIFARAGEQRPFGAGDVIFVDAGTEHRFEQFSADFATWVIFWGPRGGERGSE